MKTIESCWVAVDADGTEKISNAPFVRRKGVSKIWWGWIRVKYSKNDSRKWANSWSTDDGDAMPFMGVILPKGSIYKLTGKKITWKDEPIKL